VLIFSEALMSNEISQKGKSKKKKKVIVVKKKAINHLICGSVLKYTGNQMPDPDQPAHKGAPVACEVLVYKLTKMSDTEGDGATLFTNINTKLVKKVMSDKAGRFCAYLPIGKYSVFVNETGFGLFANIFDGEMNINPIEVIKGKNNEVKIEINHSAAY
jgi:hypothetical protein